MAVNYLVMDSGLNSDRETNSKYLKVVNQEVCDADYMANIISDQCSVTGSDIEAVLTAFQSNLKVLFGRGSSVRLSSIGLLKPKFKAEFDNNGNLIKGSERLSKIELIMDKDLRRASRYYSFVNKGEVKIRANGFVRRSGNAIEYLKAGNDEIDSSAYMLMNNCSRTLANQDFNRMMSDGLLRRRRIGKTMVYSLK